MSGNKPIVEKVRDSCGGKIILAIDPGAHMGWAFSVSGVARSGVCHFSGDLGDRLVALDEWTVRKLSGVSVLYCERPAYAPGNSTTTLWSMLGVLNMRATQLGIPFVLKSPMTIKKHATGSGRASKGEVVEAIESLHGRSVEDHNEADALALLGLALSERTSGEAGSPEPPTRGNNGKGTKGT